MPQKEWFADWFDSPFYHTLYKHRDYQEAKFFLNKLVERLELNHQDSILDLACGKGRHAIYLNRQGFDVTGVDLSVQNITQAKAYQNDRLSFFIHDMREVFRPNGFDVILNLFTSFGYFKTDDEHLLAIQAATQSLKSGGRFIIDFMNTDLILKSLVPYEEKVIDGICFVIRKKLEDGCIVKEIEFEAKHKPYYFVERVKAISQEDFLIYFQKANLKLLDIFGDYKLSGFDLKSSPRMILMVQKQV